MCGVVCCDSEKSPYKHDRTDVKAVSKIRKYDINVLSFWEKRFFLKLLWGYGFLFDKMGSRIHLPGKAIRLRSVSRKRDSEVGNRKIRMA